MSARAKPQAEPRFGLKLPDRYSVSRHIATGGMASVWCAEDNVLDRRVAIKVLSERFAHDELAIRRFKREARAAARVSAHPHVVTIFDIGDIGPDGRGSPPSAFIVMEHLSGGTVADALRCDSVTRDEARRWLHEAASALDHAHERGIVHRDIKPANFLLDRERGLHVADFGIARLQSEDTITSSGELFGTAAYLAPEQALGREATGASDRYSLAVAGFELLTGGRPFTASHFAAQARQHIEDEPPKASDREPTLPPAVDGVLRRAMAKDPGARYPTATAFIDALEGALDDQPTAATTPLLATAPTRPLKSAGAAAAAAAPRPPAATRRPATTGPTTRSGGQERGGRVIALLALAAVALGVILLISQLENGSRSSVTAASRSSHATVGHHHPKPATHTASSTASSGSAASSSGAASVSALQLLGHQSCWITTTRRRSRPCAVRSPRRRPTASPTPMRCTTSAMPCCCRAIRKPRSRSSSSG
jgi:eukaryotic-like serine/threonine-protein kinase